MTDRTAADLDLRSQLGALPVGREMIRVSGPEAFEYLQGQLSQDLRGLVVGESTWSFLLQPTSKVIAWLRVTRTADDEFLLDTDPGAGESVVARLTRFKLRMKCDIEPLEWHCVALRGPGAASAAPGLATGEAVAVDAGWPGVEGVDVLGPEATLPDGVPVASIEAYEVLRVRCGVPATGAELTEASLPNEAPRWVLDRSVSFTKGCYTGQEVVMRIDSRGGQGPKPVRGIVVSDGPTPPPGATVTRDGADVGQLTTVVVPAGEERALALAIVARKVEPPAEVELRWGDGSAAGRAASLPMD